MLKRFKSIVKENKTDIGSQNIITPLRIIGKLVSEDSTPISRQIINKTFINLLEYLQYFYNEDVPDIE
jgi:hypothetical protein